jgi:hypothetical protein
MECTSFLISLNPARHFYEQIRLLSVVRLE